MPRVRCHYEQSSYVILSGSEDLRRPGRALDPDVCFEDQTLISPMTPIAQTLRARVGAPLTNQALTETSTAKARRREETTVSS